MKVVTTPSVAYHAVWDITGHADSDNKNSTIFMERAALTGVRASTTTLMAVAALLAVASAGEPAWGAVDLEAVINMDVDFSQFRTTYSDRIEYEYGEGSLLHQYLGGRQWVVEGMASEGRDVQNLEDMLNDKIVSYNNSVKISVSDVGYEFRLEPASYGSVMERMVWIAGNLTGYLVNTPVIYIQQGYWILCLDPVTQFCQVNTPVSDIQTGYAAPAPEGSAPASPPWTRQAGVAYADDYAPVIYGTQVTGVVYNPTYVSEVFPVSEESPVTIVHDTRVDIEWLSPTVTGDIVIDGVPINMPASLLREMEPEAYDLLAGTEADAILLQPLMDAGPIRDQHVDTWHSRYHSAGTSVDADTFGLSDGVMDVDVHTWTIDVDASGVGTKGADEVAITLDQTYVVRSTHDTSSATIRTIGTGFFETMGSGEAVIASPSPPKHQSNVISESPPWIMSAFIAFILVAIIVWMLIVARRRDRRLSRNDGEQQTAAGAPS